MNSLQVNSDKAIAAAKAQSKAALASGDYGKLAVSGWRRENGRIGVRNHVVVLPLDDLSNSASEAVANNVKGTLALPHAYGRLQFGADLDLFFRTLIGIGSNP
ncbi:MAG: UxaA family hydrolase, partial [Methylobacteriaceae bacterium]|nr:UxaA family hydrolase [Methylobacteriaceae bacterium]